MVPKKTFILAISGGIDSIVLLHKLMSVKPPNIRYVVAHFDHGIRTDSAQDAQFVRAVATGYGLQFELGEASLGIHASENEARIARYGFLRSVMKSHRAEKIITAHHQDDLLETIVMNVIRGTGPRGLAPMRNTNDILRPLLHVRKQDIVLYATQHSLTWREDATNQNTHYTRNYIRMHILPLLEDHREELLQLSNHTHDIIEEIDFGLRAFVPNSPRLLRRTFITLPYCIRREVMRAWLMRHDISVDERRIVERLVIAAQTLTPGHKIDIDKNNWLCAYPHHLEIIAKNDAMSPV
jgi:tRNA(Ile)-lysidine synthetase-like protein